jgi:uncharacterized Zn-finger protein
LAKKIYLMPYSTGEVYRWSESARIGFFQIGKIDTTMNESPSPTAPVQLGAADLPAHCPNDAMPVWSSHPRVFLDMSAHGSAKCPYCGTTYCMKPGESASAH